MCWSFGTILILSQVNERIFPRASECRSKSIWLVNEITTDYWCIIIVSLSEKNENFLIEKIRLTWKTILSILISVVSYEMKEMKSKQHWQAEDNARRCYSNRFLLEVLSTFEWQKQTESNGHIIIIIIFVGERVKMPRT